MGTEFCFVCNIQLETKLLTSVFSHPVSCKSLMLRSRRHIVEHGVK